MAIIKRLFDYRKSENSCKKQSCSAYNKLYKGDSNKAEERIKTFFWYRHSESGQEVIIVNNHDNPLVRAANFWLDIAIYWR